MSVANTMIDTADNAEAVNSIAQSVYSSERHLVGPPNPNLPKLIFNADQMKALNEIMAAIPFSNISAPRTKKDHISMGVRFTIHHLNNYIEVEK